MTKLMHNKALIESAAHLQSLLRTYASQDREACGLLEALDPLLKTIERNELHKILKWDQVPGSYLFSEGNLRNIKELAQAYATFKIQVTGQADSPVLKRLREEGPPTER